MRHLGRNLRQRQRSGTKTLVQQAAAVLRKLGDGVTAWIPGVGLVNGLQAGNWLDAAGTTALTVDNPLGLAVDANATFGPELVINGNFSTADDWAQNYDGTNGWQISGGMAQHTGALNPYLNSTYPLTINKWYKITCTVTGVVKLETANLGVLSLLVGTHSYYFQATLSALRFYANSAGTIDNISVKEVTGINIIQTTTANKPSLRRGVVNLLTHSHNFTNASWGNYLGSKVGTTLIDGVACMEVSLQANGSASLEHTQPAIGIVQTIIFKIRAKSSGCKLRVQVGNTDLQVVQDIPMSWMYLVYQANGTANADAISVRNGYPGAAVNFYIAEAGVFRGTYTADQILASGGIPLTTTAEASSSSGSYFWSFDATDELTTTLPAGYEAATIISTSKAGQNTQQAQNIVGTYSLRGAVIGPELVVNGGFNADTNWAKGAGWSIDAGKAVAASASGILSQVIPVVAGKTYKVTWESTFTAGQFQLRVGGGNGGYYSTSGIKSAVVTAAATGVIEFVATSMSGNLDNVSVKEIAPEEYGHFIFKTAPSASYLAVMQRYANRLAGL